jgi:hypothetical protein
MSPRIWAVLAVLCAGPIYSQADSAGFQRTKDSLEVESKRLDIEVKRAQIERLRQTTRVDSIEASKPRRSWFHKNLGFIICGAAATIVVIGLSQPDK